MNPITIGMMTYSFHREVAGGSLDVPALVRLCADLGVEDLDLNYAHWTDPERDAPATRAALDQTGLGVASCHTTVDLVTPGPAAAEARRAEIEAVCERLATVHCRHLMLGSPLQDLEPGPWRRRYAAGLAQAAAAAQPYGITVTFENRGGSMGHWVGSFQHCLEILETANEPSLGFTFDVGNFRYMNLDAGEAFEHLADFIVHVHLKDVVPAGDSFVMVPLGEGEVDNAPIIRSLMARGWAGCLAIECGGRGTDREDAQKSIAFARRVLAEGAGSCPNSN